MVIRAAERAVQYAQERFDLREESNVIDPILHPVLWSDATYACDSEQRGEIVRTILGPAEAARILSAGEFRVTAKGSATLSSNALFRYYPTTSASFSTTARDATGTGSGWTGVNDFDITRIDVARLASRALEKCQMSVNPVALEPGRYTTILEAQAVADLFAPLFDSSVVERRIAESPRGPFGGPRQGKSKIGQRILDPRISIVADPMDTLAGFLPFEVHSGGAYYPIQWVADGVLRQLAYDRGYALRRLHLPTPLLNSSSWRITGGSTSVDEMIASTERGLLVTRFHNVQVRDLSSFTCSGYTRDGLWLIDRGKMTKPVKNFRFVESPVFAFNQLEQVGSPQRVFCQDDALARVAPPAKVRDFNFSQIADAV
jgi:predicted Zn-dependent protease